MAGRGRGPDPRRNPRRHPADLKAFGRAAAFISSTSFTAPQHYQAGTEFLPARQGRQVCQVPYEGRLVGPGTLGTPGQDDDEARLERACSRGSSRVRPTGGATGPYVRPAATASLAIRRSPTLSFRPATRSRCPPT